MPTFDVRIPATPLTILVFGAHIDDCETLVGGTAKKYADGGHRVVFVSMTDGAAGHHEMSGVELSHRRQAEGREAAAVLGVEYTFLDKPEGELTPSVPNRRDVIELIRTVEPDLILTHRPNDYHPDHRYTADLVQDSAYMVTVPNICAHTPHLSYNPVVCYLSDDFQKPAPFDPDVVVGIDDVIESKLAALDCHESQMYEWLPYNVGVLDEVPDDDARRREWLADQRLPQYEAIADRFRDRLIERYGEERGREIQYAEAFEQCEYGGRLTDENRDVLFPIE